MTKPALDLDRYTPGLITFIANKLSKGASRTYRKHFGVNVTEWRILSLLAIEPNITANRIVQVIGLDKGAVSRALEDMRQQRLVSIKADAGDARQRVIELTRAGRRVHDRIIVVAHERERRLLAQLSPEEVDTLIDLLRRLHAQIPELDAYDPAMPDDER